MQLLAEVNEAPERGAKTMLAASTAEDVAIIAPGKASCSFWPIAGDLRDNLPQGHGMDKITPGDSGDVGREQGDIHMTRTHQIIRFANDGERNGVEFCEADLDDLEIGACIGQRVPLEVEVYSRRECFQVLHLVLRIFLDET